MSGCHEPEFEKCKDRGCIACYGGHWSSIDPPVCNGKIRNSMMKPQMATYEDFIRSRILAIEEHKNYQIDENRKVSRRLDELEKQILETRIQFIDKLGNEKKPHKCCVCEGTGNHSNQTPRLMVLAKTQTGIICCEACDGKGVLWS